MKRRRKVVRTNMEKVILAVSALLIMTVCTVTGVVIRQDMTKEEQDGYVVDFSALEVKNETIANEEEVVSEIDKEAEYKAEVELDYDPTYEFRKEMTQVRKNVRDNKPVQEAQIEETAGMIKEELETEQAEVAVVSVQPALHFTEKDLLQWPVVGDVLINYSMDKTVYFPSLDQYKYNPGIVISAAQGTAITAPATGRVTSIKKDPQYGNMVIMDLGNGYELSCGQLDELRVSEGSFVNVGDPIGCIGAPTKYFYLEGSNLYLSLRKDGVPISPLPQME